VTPPAIHIRTAEPMDVDQLARLRAALWPDESPALLRAEAARFLTQLRRGPGAMPEVVFVAATQDPAPALVGFAEVSRRFYAEGCESSPVGFLEGWYVVPERRREGIGRALVAAAEDWARQLGCTEFASDALAENTDTAAAHRALGFEEVEIIRCFRKELALAP